MPAKWLDDMLEFAIIPSKVFYLDIDVDNLLSRVLSNRELDHWESGEDFLRETDRHDSFVKYQAAMLQEFIALPASTTSRRWTPGRVCAWYSRRYRSASASP